MDKIYNGIIKSVALSNQDHGILTAYLMIEHEMGSQGFGGYQLFTPKQKGDRAGWFIWRTLETVLDDTGGEWDDLVGEAVRVKVKDNGLGTIRAIGHFIKDRWFSPYEEMEKK